MKKIKEWRLKNRELLNKISHIAMYFSLFIIFISAIANLFSHKFEVAFWKLISVLYITINIGIEKQLNKATKITNETLEQFQILLEALEKSGILAKKFINKSKTIN